MLEKNVDLVDLPSFKISCHAAASSAAVEQLFTIEKDILKLKHCGLSDI